MNRFLLWFQQKGIREAGETDLGLISLNVRRSGATRLSLIA